MWVGVGAGWLVCVVWCEYWFVCCVWYVFWVLVCVLFNVLGFVTYVCHDSVYDRS